MVSYMDDSVGLIIDSIQANSDSSSVFWDNTLVVLHSDNGGEIIFVGTCGGNNYPLRGGKFSNWEGGVRSFGIVSGGYLPEARRGIIESNLVGIEDWYATYCGLLGIDPSDQVAENSDLPAIDSINQWSLVLGDYDTPPRTEVVIGDTSALGYNGQGDTLVGGLIRLVNGTFYKLLIGASNKDYMIDQDVLPGPFFPDVHDIHGDASNVPLLLRPQAHTRQCSRTLSTSFTLTQNQTSTTCLFDVVSNPTEDPDYELAAQLPDLFQDMLSRIDELQATVLSPFRGEEDPMACDQALNGYNGYWGPWLGLEGTN
jgi:arylsulfatase I/J